MNKEVNIKFKFDDIPYNSIYFIQNYIDINTLLNEIINKPRIKWHTHTIVDNPESIELFNELISKISKDFNITPIKARINHFDKNTIKEYHKDFYKQDFTIVLNLHHGRVLFKQDKTESIIDFHLEPGTLYIFDKTVNNYWTHRVEMGDTDRISIVVWGKINY
jgi:hypothetical protein